MSGHDGPLWLELEPDPVFAWLHPSDGAESRRAAVLIIPPFGWDEMCSFRGRRAWARSLAEAGYPAARMDLPGTGDSGGSPRDPQRVEAWVDAVSGAAAWLRSRTAVDRVAAIGIGLGGVLACRAVTDGAPIDDLVLWAVPARGRMLLRELRAQSAMIAGRHPDDAEASPPLPEGAAELAGFLMTAETATDLGRLDLTELSIPDAANRRALLLARESLGPDKRLRGWLEQAGVQITVSDGAGYDALMSPPQETRAPAEAIAASLQWLESSGPGRVPRPERDPVRERSAVELQWEGGAVTERPVTFETATGTVVGILSEPPGGPMGSTCGVLLNAGAMRRIGPNRTWVELGRRWAARGVPTLRMDLAGIGDAPGDDQRYRRNAGLYSVDLIDQTRAVLDGAPAEGLPGRFVLAGLCSGANWALHAAVGDARAAATLMVNLYPVRWSDALHEEWETRKAVASLRGRAWRRFVRRDVKVADFVRAVRSIGPSRLLAGRRNASEASQTEETDRALDGLRDQGTQVLLLLGDEEPLYAQFEREGRLSRLGDWPNVTLERIPSTDHSFRALWVQQHVQESLDRGLSRALDAPAHASSTVKER